MISVSEDLNIECYCALAVSILGPNLVCPEVAFASLGVNVFQDKSDQKKYVWDRSGPLFWKELQGLRDDGWHWRDIGRYYGITKKAAISFHYKGKKKWGGKVEQMV